MPKQPDFGALVISLDFAIHWGVRYRYPANTAYSARLANVRRVIPAVLRVFEEFDVAATWATVGFLFARSRDELYRFSPDVRPTYLNQAYSPYDEPVGESEDDDPLHYAPTLITAIRRTARQEVGTHTFSHYYCQEAGQDREAFRADLASAVGIAQAQGIQLRSVVFPRNQHNAAYDDLLVSAGIRCFRGNTPGWMYRSTLLSDGKSLTMRGGRVLNAYTPLSGRRTVPWHALPQPSGLCNLPASLFLRPYSARLRGLEPLRLRRIDRLMQRAAASNEIIHLYWHPHSFGPHLDANIAFLRQVLERFARYRRSHGMQSLSMIAAADAAAAASSQGQPR
ncbi:MAG: polysaccharide deacetylase family protein [Gemmatimonadaceae bacterium]